MFDIIPNDEQKVYAYGQVFAYDFGKRGKADGNKNQQAVGILAQTILADLLNLPRPCGADGFDGGYDFVINGKRCDLKTMTRKGYVKSEYVHNLIAYQENYDVDFYIFASWNTTNGFLTICGVADKGLLGFCDRYKKGEKRKRADGSEIELKADLIEVKQEHLYEVCSLADLYKVIT